MGTERETQDETFQVHPVNKYKALDGDIVYMCVTCFSTYMDKNQFVNHVRKCGKRNDLNAGTGQGNKDDTILSKKSVTKNDGDGKKIHSSINQNGSSNTHQLPALQVKEELMREEENNLGVAARKENNGKTVIRKSNDGDGKKIHPFKNQNGNSNTNQLPALQVKEELMREEENNLGVAARKENNGKTVIRKSNDGDGKKIHPFKNQNGNSNTHQLPVLQIKEELVREDNTSLGVAARNESNFELKEKLIDHQNKSKCPTIIMTSESCKSDTTTPAFYAQGNDSHFWMCPVCCSVFEHRVLLENHEIECRAEHGATVTENLPELAENGISVTEILPELAENGISVTEILPELAENGISVTEILPELAENGISVTAGNENNCYVQNDIVDTNELSSADDIHRRNNSRAKRKSGVNIHSQREACAKKKLTISLGEKVTECQMCHHYFTGTKQFKRHKLLCNEMYEQIERSNKINEEQKVFDTGMENHTKSDTELTEEDGISTERRIIFAMTDYSCKNISEVNIEGENDAKTGGANEAYTGEVKRRLKEKVKLRLGEKVKLSEAKTGEETKLRLEGKVKLGLREKVNINEVKTGGESYGMISRASEVNSGGGSEAHVAGESDADIGGESDTNNGGEKDANTGGKSKANIAGENDANITGQSDANITGQSDANIAGQSDANITGQSDANIAGQSDANITGQSDANITGQSDANIAGQSDANIAGESDIKTGGEIDSHTGEDIKANSAGEYEESCEDSKMQTRMSLRKVHYRKSKVQRVNENSIEGSESSNDDKDNESEYTSECDSDSIDSDEFWGRRKRKTTSTANRKHECHFKFISSNHLTSHLRIHSGEKPFECGACHKQFTRNHTLKEHVSNKVCLNSNENPSSANRKHECHVCHFKFISSNHLTSHLRIHSGEKPFECGACHKQFTRNHTLKEHVSNKVCLNSNENPVLPRKPSKNTSFRNKPRPFRCTNCDTRFTTSGNLGAHIRNKTCENRVPDENKVIVDDSSSSESELDEESEMSTEVMSCCYVEHYTKIDTNFECKHCHKTFDSRNKIEYHIKAQEDKMKQRKADYICKICNEEFDMKCKLVRHRIVKHNGDKVKCGKNNDDGSVCYKTFSNHIKLRAHILNVHPKKRYLCTICGLATKRGTDLKRHILTHNTERTFKCTEGTCDKAYTTAHKLREHIRAVHERKINFMCDLCPKTFLKKHQFDVHKRVHSGEQPYKCDICDMKFGAYCSKKRHEVTHTQLKKYVCSVCDKSFTQSQSLKRHMITHTGKTPYRCEPCDLNFPESYRLKLHNEKVHD